MGRGISANLLKASAQRRRSKVEIQRQKDADKEREQEIQEKLEELEKMKAEYDEFYQKRQKLEESNLLVGKMFENGLLKDEGDGQVSNVDDPLER